MNSQLAVGVTLLVASVSGFAIWQEEPRPVAPAAMPAAPEPTPTVAAARPLAPWLSDLLQRWSQHDLAIDLQRGEGSLSLRIRWQQRPQVVAIGPR